MKRPFSDIEREAQRFADAYEEWSAVAGLFSAPEAEKAQRQAAMTAAANALLKAVKESRS